MSSQLVDWIMNVFNCYVFCIWCLKCLMAQHDWSNKTWMIAKWATPFKNKMPPFPPGDLCNLNGASVFEPQEQHFLLLTRFLYFMCFIYTHQVHQDQVIMNHLESSFNVKQLLNKWGHVVPVGVTKAFMHGWNCWHTESLLLYLHIFLIYI